MRIQCVIIDDEPSSQNVLLHFIDKVEFLQLKGICNDGVEALKLLNNTAVDLLFLDINMPNVSGMEFYKMLVNPPPVIFTTAYAEHAMEGFDLAAIDYLLKPFSFARFLQAVLKAKEQIKISPDQTFISLKSDKKIYQVKIDSILFIEAQGDYIKVHTEEKSLLCYKTLTKVFELLPKDMFIQVHKSYIIQREKMDYIEGNQIRIASTVIPIGLKYKTDFINLLNI
ncbi:LytTR family DNA-binding domain-containing protein [Tenacibaculum sp. SG-28]|uniref:LytR/AlgR family response regulator transcription factor n=1 Tax=Tenacibaculum sp. SG-28 TaxID=754426 RepID=UPI000CF5535C|nr:LytTR family DNA-binding domain-containing protein [Tenacibaculum sp. SG-28]PQJ21865.1 hypothetical protein BSU00_07430 [Tenacibaculum sp. SG-28]